MRLASPEDSIRELKLTDSPHMSKANFLMPTTPAITGPVWMPMRTFHGASSDDRSSTAFTISKAASTASTGWDGFRSGSPPTSM